MPRFKYFILIFILPLLLIAGVSVALNLNKEFAEVKFGDEAVMAEVARTSFARVKGLGGRERLAKNSGMLFVFENEGYHGIWMKKMNFPLDILWISDNTVVDIVKNAPSQGNTPDAFLKVYTPGSTAQYVFELNAGATDRLGIEIGSPVKILFQN